MDDIFESRGVRVFVGYIVCYAIGLVAAIVFAMINEPFAINASSMISQHATALAIVSLIILPVVGAVVVLAIMAICLGAVAVLASL